MLVSIGVKGLYNSARALGLKNQADFFRNDTWTSLQTNSEEAAKIPLVHFFLIQNGRHHVTPFSKKTGVYHNSSLLQLERNI